MKVLVFGSNGMLGRYVKTYLEDKYDLLPLTRENLDLSKSTEKQILSFLADNVGKDDVIINASGLIKQRSVDPVDMIKVNSIFPQILAKFKELIGCEVIHITTDCVFNGSKGCYVESDPHDCYDVYGRSKSLGENNNNTNIRTSIIGEEVSNKFSLLEWVFSMEDQTIQGFQNHIWNGVTCLELAKLIHKIIEGDIFWSGTRHVFSPNSVSKSSLIERVIEVYGLNISVERVDSQNDCFRGLSSSDAPLIQKDIYEQLVEMRDFNLKERVV
jgi:dTDP-4-dehydrorhamnose reductase